MATGIVLTAAYLLWMVQRVFLGPWTTQEKHGDHLEPAHELKDLTAREWFTLTPLAILCLWIGLYCSYYYYYYYYCC